jgi:hypothetical protein
MGQTYGEVIYKNALRDSPTYTGTTLSGFEPQNAYDWRDFSLFKIISGATSDFVATPASGTVIDRLVVYAGASVGTLTVTASYESAPSVWTSLGSLVVTDPGIFIVNLTSRTTAGERVRVRVAASFGDSTIRQLVLGGALVFPIGQHVGLAPPGASLFHGVVVDNVIAVNGSILARNYRREVRAAAISLEYLDPAWVRSTWTPFAQHMARYACIWRWDPESHPLEVVFAAATGIEAPENSMPPPRMRVSMPLRCLV